MVPGDPKVVLSGPKMRASDSKRTQKYSKNAPKTFFDPNIFFDPKIFLTPKFELKNDFDYKLI